MKPSALWWPWNTAIHKLSGVFHLSSKEHAGYASLAHWIRALTFKKKTKKNARLQLDADWTQQYFILKLFWGSVFHLHYLSEMLRSAETGHFLRAWSDFPIKDYLLSPSPALHRDAASQISRPPKPSLRVQTENRGQRQAEGAKKLACKHLILMSAHIWESPEICLYMLTPLGWVKVVVRMFVLSCG